MWEDVGRAICLVLIIEGMLPFLYPNRWRQLAAKLALIDDRSIRMMGLVSMLIGVGVLYVIA